MPENESEDFLASYDETLIGEDPGGSLPSPEFNLDREQEKTRAALARLLILFLGISVSFSLLLTLSWYFCFDQA